MKKIKYLIAILFIIFCIYAIKLLVNRTHPVNNVTDDIKIETTYGSCECKKNTTNEIYTSFEDKKITCDIGVTSNHINNKPKLQEDCDSYASKNGYYVCTYKDSLITHAPVYSYKDFINCGGISFKKMEKCDNGVSDCCQGADAICSQNYCYYNANKMNEVNANSCANQKNIVTYKTTNEVATIQTYVADAKPKKNTNTVNTGNVSTTEAISIPTAILQTYANVPKPTSTIQNTSTAKIGSSVSSILFNPNILKTTLIISGIVALVAVIIGLKILL